MESRAVKKRSRRQFMQHSAAATAVAAFAAASPPPTTAAPARVGFFSRWDQSHDRVWLGPEYWANPLQDWRVAGGRIECIKAAPNRNVNLLTRQLAEEPGDLH